MAVEQRDFFWDNAKFILMVSVVMCHAIGVVSNPVLSVAYNFIYLFHMPCFIMITGYFTKRQKATRLGLVLTQYLVFQTLYQLSYYIVYHSAYSGSIYGTPFWIMWYLLASLFWKIIIVIVPKKFSTFIISVIMALLAGYDGLVGEFMALSQSIVFFPFFFIGYMFKPEYLEKVKNLNVFLKLGFGSAVFILLYFVNLPDKMQFYQYMPYADYFPEYLLMFAWGVRFLILLAGLALSLIFLSMIPAKKYVLGSLGSRTFQVYVLHGFFINLLAVSGIGEFVTSPLHEVVFFTGVLLFTLLLFSKPVSYCIKPLQDPFTFFQGLKKGAAHETQR